MEIKPDKYRVAHVETFPTLARMYAHPPEPPIVVGKGSDVGRWVIADTIILHTVNDVARQTTWEFHASPTATPNILAAQMHPRLKALEAILTPEEFGGYLKAMIAENLTTPLLSAWYMDRLQEHAAR